RKSAASLSLSNTGPNASPVTESYSATASGPVIRTLTGAPARNWPRAALVGPLAAGRARARVAGWVAGGGCGRGRGGRRRAGRRGRPVSGRGGRGPGSPGHRQKRVLDDVLQLGGGLVEVGVVHSVHPDRRAVLGVGERADVAGEVGSVAERGNHAHGELVPLGGGEIAEHHCS